MFGQPLWRLWGGYRNRIQMISIGGYYGPDADVRAEVTELRERGLAGIKFKVGGLTPEEDAERFRRPREAGGADFLLAADANQGWMPQEAIALRATRRGSRPLLVRGAVPLAATIAGRCGTSASPPACTSVPARASSRPRAAAT